MTTNRKKKFFVGFALTIVAIAFVYIALIAYAPSKIIKGLRQPISETPATMGIDFKQVEFFTKDKVKIVAWWMPAKKAKGAIIIVHGGGSNRRGTYMKSLKLTKKLIENNYCALAIDLRGHGESGDFPEGKLTIGSGQALDVIAAVNWLQSYHPKLPIGTIGASLGGATVLFAGFQDSRIKATIAIDPVLNPEMALSKFIWASFQIPQWIAPHFLWSAKTFYKLDLGDNAIVVGSKVINPLLLIQNVADPIVSVVEARKLKNLNPKIEYWETPAPAKNSKVKLHPRWGTHVRTFALYPKKFAMRVVQFYNRNLF